MQLLSWVRPRTLMNSRPFLASLLCASLACLAPAAARAGTPPAGLNAASQLILTSWAREPVTTSVLGLRGDDQTANAELTAALRSAFAEREMSGGQDLTLEEVVLTLDCSSEQDTACMTEAGRALESDRLVYGTLAATSDGYTIDLSVLDVATGQIEAQATMPVEADALSPESIDATAQEVVNSLYPKADDSVVAPIPTGDLEDTGDDEIEPQRDDPDSKYVWGPYKPRPAWKKAGLGIGATLLIGGIATGIVGGVLVGYYEDQVAEFAQRAENDDNVNNDVTLAGPNRAGVEAELARAGKEGTQCDVAFVPARFRADGEDAEGRVLNGDIATYCRDGKYSAIVSNVGWATAGVGAALTITFTVLYFVHKKDEPGANARKRTFQLTGGPTQGGAMIGGIGRF